MGLRTKHISIPEILLKELCSDLEAYVKDSYKGNLPITIKSREANLEVVKEARILIANQESPLDEDL